MNQIRSKFAHIVTWRKFHRSSVECKKNYYFELGYWGGMARLFYVVRLFFISTYFLPVTADTGLFPPLSIEHKFYLETLLLLEYLRRNSRVERDLLRSILIIRRHPLHHVLLLLLHHLRIHSPHELWWRPSWCLAGPILSTLRSIWFLLTWKLKIRVDLAKVNVKALTASC